MSAFFPTSKLPIVSDRPIAWAALIVVAVKTSSGVIPMLRQPKFIINCSESVGDEPGLASVDNATGTPISIIYQARAYSYIKKKAVQGSKTPIKAFSAII